MRLLLLLSDAYRRILAVFLGVAGPGLAYRFSGALARVIYRSLDVVRARTEAQCRAALGRHVPEPDVPALAERSFQHRIWNLTDLMLADRLLHPGTHERYGGRIAEPFRGMLRAAQARRRPVILLTAYHGPYDLLPAFLGYNGLPAAVVYRPHANPRFDVYRNRIRARAGCKLIPIDQALEAVPRTLEAGGTVALVADHHVEGRGVPGEFLGLPTVTSRLIGLLAERHEAYVVTAGIRRLRSFHFEMTVSGVLRSEDWRGESDPVARITAWYLAGLEKIILRDPSQYLWSYARWGESMTERLIESASTPAGPASALMGHASIPAEPAPAPIGRAVRADEGESAARRENEKVGK